MNEEEKYQYIMSLSNKIRGKILDREDLLSLLDDMESNKSLLSSDNRYTLLYDILSIQNVNSKIFHIIEKFNELPRVNMQEALRSNMYLHKHKLLEKIKLCGFTIIDSGILFAGYDYRKSREDNSFLSNGSFFIQPSLNDFYDCDLEIKTAALRYYTKIDNISSICFPDIHSGGEIFLNVFDPDRCIVSFRKL